MSTFNLRLLNSLKKVCSSWAQARGLRICDLSQPHPPPLSRRFPPAFPCGVPFLPAPGLLPPRMRVSRQLAYYTGGGWPWVALGSILYAMTVLIPAPNTPNTSRAPGGVCQVDEVQDQSRHRRGGCRFTRSDCRLRDTTRGILEKM